MSCAGMRRRWPWERELPELVGLDVELVDYRSVVEWSDDYTRRKTVLESAQVILAA